MWFIYWDDWHSLCMIVLFGPSTFRKFKKFESLLQCKGSELSLSPLTSPHPIEIQWFNLTQQAPNITECSSDLDTDYGSHKHVIAVMCDMHDNRNTLHNRLNNSGQFLHTELISLKCHYNQMSLSSTWIAQSWGYGCQSQSENNLSTVGSCRPGFLSILHHCAFQMIVTFPWYYP